MNDLKGRDVLDTASLSREQVDTILQVAGEMKEQLESQSALDLLGGKVLATLFFEPSTRTRLSFETAMIRLGGKVIGFSSPDASSVAKGETLEDTVLTVDQYADILAIRHPEIGSAARAAAVAYAPVINGGDGAGQHPTQALLDLFTLQQELGELHGATLVLCGDLKYGRTVHSGVHLFGAFGCRLIFVSPEQLALPQDLLIQLRDEGVDFSFSHDLDQSIHEADAVYMTRVQKERFENPDEYIQLKSQFVLTEEMVAENNPDIVILHPLPRVDELDRTLDAHPNAAYFRQVRNGVFVRMALLSLLLGTS